MKSLYCPPFGSDRSTPCSSLRFQSHEIPLPVISQVRNLSVNQRQMQKHIKSISKNLDKMAKSLSQAKDFEGSLGSDAYTSEASSMSGASDRSRRAKNSSLGSRIRT